MPAAFTKCVKNGGKVRRKRVNKDTYINICITPNGTTIAGEPHKIKEK